MNAPRWSDHARPALEEDRAREDVTTSLVAAAARHRGVGRLVAESRFVMAGLPLVRAVFEELAAATVTRPAVVEGGWAETGQVVARIEGPVAALLAGERVALNFLQHLAGVATATRRAVDAVEGTGAVITDTRKTTPGLRELEKYAVRVGGGVNHRMSLADGILWKDNHWTLLSAGGGTLADALARAPQGMPVQVEVESERQLEIALAAGVTSLLVDNQEPDTVREWVRRAGPGVVIEASGGITPGTAAAYAAAGAKRVSIGSLTSAPDGVSIRFDITVGSDD